MSLVLLNVVAAGLVGGVLSVLAAALLSFRLPRLWLSRAVGLSAGMLLGSALLVLLPEALELSDYPDPRAQFAWLLAGLLGFHVLERLALWRHDHGGVSRHAAHEAPTPPLLVLLGDGVHNFGDGVLLAAAFLVDPLLGWSTALAVAAHEVPQEMGDFVLLLEAGWSRTRALLANAAASVASVAGGVLGVLALSEARQWLPAVLTLAAAGFIHIAVADLLPWLGRRRERHAPGWHAVAIATGLALVLAVPHVH